MHGRTTLIGTNGYIADQLAFRALRFLARELPRLEGSIGSNQLLKEPSTKN